MTDSPPDVPPPDIGENPAWAKNPLAKEEARKWGSLDDTLERNDVLWATTYGWVLVGFTVVFALLFVASLVIWALHYLAPDSWTWLSPEKLSKVQSVLFSGGMGAVVSGIVQKQITKSDKKRP